MLLKGAILGETSLMPMGTWPSLGLHRKEVPGISSFLGFLNWMSIRFLVSVGLL